MPETSVSYKCPNCGAPLSFKPGNDKVSCEYCGAELDIKAVEDLFRSKEELAVKAQEAKEAKWQTQDAGEEWTSDEAQNLKAFTCSS